MRSLYTLGTTIAFLVFFLASCKEDSQPEPKPHAPSISFAVQGAGVSEEAVNVSVTKDSTITIDYTVTAEASIQEVRKSVDGNEEVVSDANGREEFFGEWTISVPFASKTINLELTVIDSKAQVTTKSISVIVTEKLLPVEGGTAAFAFKATSLSYDAEITATTDGSGGFTFGTKLQAAPVLFDEVNNVFENGVRNPVRDHHAQGQEIEITKENPNEVYTDRGGSGPSFFETQNNLRVPGKPVFWMPGASNTLHRRNPTKKSPYPKDGNKTIYVGWHVRTKYDARLYNRYKQDINGESLNASSGFIGPKPGELYGETVTGNGISGRITGISDRGISFEMIPVAKAPEIGSTGFGHNVVVVGETSGASFTTNTKGGESTFQGEGSNKLIRIWSEDGSDPTVRISWTQMHLTGDGIEQYDGSYWSTAGYQMKQNWVFMEFLLTQDRMTAKLDGKILHDGDVSQLILPPGVAVNIGMIGFNGNSSQTQITQETYISEIYMDHSPKRFYLANAATIEEATKVELQMPIEWEDQKVTMKARLGNLDPAADKIYLIYAADHTETGAVAIN